MRIDRNSLHLKTDRENMTNVTRNSISINANFDLEAAPDCALIKLHFTGEGMTLEDAVATAQRQVAEATSALKANHSSIESIHVVDVYVGQKWIAFDLRLRHSQDHLLCKAF